MESAEVITTPLQYFALYLDSAEVYLVAYLNNLQDVVI